jgi:hypothetical protein
MWARKGTDWLDIRFFVCGSLVDNAHYTIFQFMFLPEICFFSSIANVDIVQNFSVCIFNIYILGISLWLYFASLITIEVEYLFAWFHYPFHFLFVNCLVVIITFLLNSLSFSYFHNSLYILYVTNILPSLCLISLILHRVWWTKEKLLSHTLWILSIWPNNSKCLSIRLHVVCTPNTNVWGSLWPHIFPNISIIKCSYFSHHVKYDLTSDSQITDESEHIFLCFEDLLF